MRNSLKSLRKNKKKNKKTKDEVLPVEKDNISSEPSEFVDDRGEDGNVFGEDGMLSDDFESLEGDPENEPDFS